MASHINVGVPGTREFIPLNTPPIGTAESADPPALFKPLTIKGVEFKNRIWAAPMCQYSSQDGHATDWHFVHIGSLATRGVGSICIEATAVVPEGRISPEDAGLWTDSQIAPLKRIVEFSHAHGTKIGIQLAHAGRKASTYAPWIKDRMGHGTSWTAQVDENGWPDNTYAPSAISFHDKIYPDPKAMTEEDMKYVEDAFVAAAKRCHEVGFDFIEVHAAHGYLIHEFVSPLSNHRTDEYGGSLENRLRFPTRIVQRVREAWGHDKPLFVRISASDWAEGPEKSEDGKWLQWGIEQSTIWAGELHKQGICDFLDASSGGNWQEQKIPVKHGYQVHFSEAIKKAHPDLLVGAVGMITDPLEAEAYVKEGKADVVSLARGLLRDPHWALSAAKLLGVQVKSANQASGCRSTVSCYNLRNLFQQDVHESASEVKQPTKTCPLQALASSWLEGGAGGSAVAKNLATKLPSASVTLINPLPYLIARPTLPRMTVSDSNDLFDTALVPYDKLFIGTNGKFVKGTVETIRAEKKGGSVVLADGQEIGYDVLVLAPGSVWDGPTAVPNDEAEVSAFVAQQRAMFANAEKIVLVGGGAVSIEYAGEIKDIWPKKNVTIVHAGDALLNPAYPPRFRKALESTLHSRGIKIILNDAVDEFPPGGTPVKTRNGAIIDADLVVPVRGPQPRTEFVSKSLGAEALDERGQIKVSPTLQLLNHPNIFAIGDAINVVEQKQVMKAVAHAEIVTANVVSKLSGSTKPLKAYKGSPEMIIVTNGKNGGRAYLGFLWGIVLGDWFAKMIKAKTLLVPMVRGGMGY
ncbi:hypothetical protein HMN09_00650200 [Mycena chlorophos]|uniref:NADH:flavin oxidoreductase/NADH oxidase N-terminal domain-containing protein n=1 Tax=Mycena chlorophos TaxID=658473 RepID=A0A8H6WG20_MYCCL|nr:hypothetical protein HMN09_00650200 [Mycena chlorophos]